MEEPEIIDPCPICYEDYKDNNIIFDCKHMVCFDCYDKLINNNNIVTLCPLCRAVIDENIYVDRRRCRWCNHKVFEMFLTIVFIIIKVLSIFDRDFII